GASPPEAQSAHRRGIAGRVRRSSGLRFAEPPRPCLTAMGSLARQIASEKKRGYTPGILFLQSYSRMNPLHYRPMRDNLPDYYGWRNTSESAHSKERAGEHHFGHAKVNDESGDIDQSRHKRSRRTGRIKAAAPQNKWQHRSRDSPEGHNAEQAQRDGNSHQQVILSIGLCHRLPDNDSKKSNGAEQAPQCYSRHQLAADYAPPVSEAQLSQGHGANDQGGGLRPGVASAADEQRDEQCQNDSFLDLMLIVSHRRRGQHFAQKQDHQPTGALAKHGHESGLQIRSVQGFHATDLLDLLGVFL